LTAHCRLYLGIFFDRPSDEVRINFVRFIQLTSPRYSVVVCGRDLLFSLIALTLIPVLAVSHLVRPISAISLSCQSHRRDLLPSASMAQSCVGLDRPRSAALHKMMLLYPTFFFPVTLSFRVVALYNCSNKIAIPLTIYSLAVVLIAGTITAMLTAHIGSMYLHAVLYSLHGPHSFFLQQPQNQHRVYTAARLHPFHRGPLT
jgi:uncharacterized membrane protein